MAAMANAVQEVLHVCRFCLCQDEAFLKPLEDMLDFTTCVQDVATLTGIQLTEDNIVSYCMCLDCLTELKSYIDFRKTCLSNDAKFRELYAEMIRSQDRGGLSTKEDDAKEVGAAIKDIVPLADNTDESSDFDIGDLDGILGDSESEKEEAPKPDEREAETPTIEFVCTNKSKPTNWKNPCKCQSCVWKDILTPDWADSGADAFSYSANYIPPGEILYTEPAVNHDDWLSLNPKPPTFIPNPPQHGVRKLHVCELCGLKVRHIKSHMPTHLQDYTFNCPYCDVKAKQNNTLNEHIRTVHMKIARNKCKICGRKFIHHKTYRYHMLSHEGKTFECPDCSKSFSNAIYLRDHVNRLHNVGKLGRQISAAEQENRRKRNRSKAIVEYEETNSREDISAVNAIVE